MKKRQLKQRREIEEDHLKNTSGLGLNPQTSPSCLIPRYRRRRKAEEQTQAPGRDVA